MAPGCAAYQKGSFSHAPAPELARRVTTGCLDVSVSGSVLDGVEGQVVEVRFANRCDQPVEVDLSALEPTGRFADGRSRPLTIYDPQGVVVPHLLDGRSRGIERVALVAPEGAELLEWCVDLAGLDAARRGPPRQVCGRARPLRPAAPYRQPMLTRLLTADRDGLAYACPAVVGHCRKFGEGWRNEQRPWGHFEIGTGFHSINAAELDFDDGSGQPIRVGDRLDLTTVEAGFSNHLVGGLHAGLSVGIGGGDGGQRGAVLLLTSGVHVGYRHSIGRWTARLRLYGGLRTMTLTETVSAKSMGGLAEAHQLVLQTRLGIERWINPWWSVGAWAGVEALRERELSMGFGVRGYLWSFDRRN